MQIKNRNSEFFLHNKTSESVQNDNKNIKSNTQYNPMDSYDEFEDFDSYDNFSDPAIHHSSFLSEKSKNHNKNVLSSKNETIDFIVKNFTDDRIAMLENDFYAKISELESENLISSQVRSFYTNFEEKFTSMQNLKQDLLESFNDFLNDHNNSFFLISMYKQDSFKTQKKIYNEDKQFLEYLMRFFISKSSNTQLINYCMSNLEIDKNYELDNEKENFFLYTFSQKLPDLISKNINFNNEIKRQAENAQQLVKKLQILFFTLKNTIETCLKDISHNDYKYFYYTKDSLNINTENFDIEKNVFSENLDEKNVANNNFYSQSSDRNYKNKTDISNNEDCLTDFNNVINDFINEESNDFLKCMNLNNNSYAKKDNNSNPEVSEDKNDKEKNLISDFYGKKNIENFYSNTNLNNEPSVSTNSQETYIFDKNANLNDNFNSFLSSMKSTLDFQNNEFKSLQIFIFSHLHTLIEIYSVQKKIQSLQKNYSYLKIIEKIYTNFIKKIKENKKCYLCLQKLKEKDLNIVITRVNYILEKLPARKNNINMHLNELNELYTNIDQYNAVKMSCNTVFEGLQKFCKGLKNMKSQIKILSNFAFLRSKTNSDYKNDMNLSDQKNNIENVLCEDLNFIHNEVCEDSNEFVIVEIYKLLLPLKDLSFFGSENINENVLPNIVNINNLETSQNNNNSSNKNIAKNTNDLLDKAIYRNDKNFDNITSQNKNQSYVSSTIQNIVINNTSTQIFSYKTTINSFFDFIESLTSVNTIFEQKHDEHTKFLNSLRSLHSKLLRYDENQMKIKVELQNYTKNLKPAKIQSPKNLEKKIMPESQNTNKHKNTYIEDFIENLDLLLHKMETEFFTTIEYNKILSFTQSFRNTHIIQNEINNIQIKLKTLNQIVTLRNLNNKISENNLQITNLESDNLKIKSQIQSNEKNVSKLMIASNQIKNKINSVNNAKNDHDLHFKNIQKRCKDLLFAIFAILDKKNIVLNEYIEKVKSFLNKTSFIVKNINDFEIHQSHKNSIVNNILSKEIDFKNLHSISKDYQLHADFPNKNSYITNHNKNEFLINEKNNESNNSVNFKLVKDFLEYHESFINEFHNFNLSNTLKQNKDIENENSNINSFILLQKISEILLTKHNIKLTKHDIIINNNLLIDKIEFIIQFIDNFDKYLLGTQKELNMQKTKFANISQNHQKYTKMLEKIQKTRLKLENDNKIQNIQQNLDKINFDQINNIKNEAAIRLERKNTYLHKKYTLIGELQSLKTKIKEKTAEIDENTEKIYYKAYLELETLKLIKSDTLKCLQEIEKRIKEYHEEMMLEVNSKLKDLWVNTYQGNDIDYIQIDTDINEKTLNYTLVLVKNNTKLDMKGRSSAGQKMLACILVRIALCDVFSNDFRVLALDEPTTNLDNNNVEALAITINNVIKKCNLQFVLITHDFRFAKMIDNSEETVYHVIRDENGDSCIFKKSIHDM
ncbi:hypothetical protein EDEG_02456 [Edhazardia aedis USNM 41457]|uniref:DNA repair protein RAD50 n=1 Tax=Edhazardia aedis (strain USNM 41457) TaxID=1003232 RepID=J9D5U8_EDHAE|nr:hypothetical protein EDEG_02456 [Edhazardia aedis USNM 41457]|eukprot:EJW03151.1 hypothetical protein EDEG_02456 [Edhazardia aedis USNM 41457]